MAIKNNYNFSKCLERDLVNEGHDVWEIELNGGENTECPTCPDYTYQDQVDYFWPALVAGVMNYSAKNQVNYIGHSNGCRVALSSLNSYSNGKNGTGFGFNTITGVYDINLSLPNIPVDKFFGVACPGFANVVDRILNNNNFEVAIRTVRTLNDNTTLRLKNINSDFSTNFTDAVVGNNRPVVLARGLWSNLLSWQDFGEELAFDKENARDTWLIEITGGPFN